MNPSSAEALRPHPPRVQGAEAGSGEGRGGRSRLHLAAAIGTGVEWFDFAVYGYYANDLGRLFFPSKKPLRNLTIWTHEHQ